MFRFLGFFCVVPLFNTYITDGIIVYLLLLLDCFSVIERRELVGPLVFKNMKNFHFEFSYFMSREIGLI